MGEFNVTAGKIDMGELNIKYASSFKNIDDAINAYIKCNGYQFRRLEYNGWIIEVK